MADQLALLPPAGSHIAVLGACGGIGAEVVRSLLDGSCIVTAMDLPGSLSEAPSPAQRSIAFDGRDGVDALVHLAIEDQLLAPPAMQADGKCWLVGPSPTGPWSVQAGSIACLLQGQWLFQPQMDGLRPLNRATGQQIYYLGSWRIAAKPASPTGGTTIDP